MNKLVYLIFAFLMVWSGCTKIKEKKNLSTTDNPAYLDTTVLSTHTMSNVALAPNPVTPGNPASRTLSLAVNTSLAGFTSLQGYCGIGATNPCACELVWNETNTVGNNAQTVTRTKRLTVKEVQSGLVKCDVTEAFWAEIANGTTIHMNIIPLPQAGNATALSVTSLAYKKGTSTSGSGDFYDSTLTPFRNIHRYTCITKNTSFHEILNQTTQMTTADGDPVNVLLGNKFCADPNGGSGCAIGRNGYSAQNYYRNLYVRSDKIGKINSQNSLYYCPKVEESILYSAGATVPAAEKGKYWPLDTQFSLATSASSEWSVPVAAASAVTKVGDPDTGSNDGACVNEPDPNGPNSRRMKESGNGIVTKCLGYAKTPRADGTCGTITDSNGRVRPMVRLRRYRVVYPSFYDASQNFKPRARNPDADEVLVADRLVLNNLGIPTGDMIYGPKPCNFAWFDHEGVVKRDGTVDFGSHLQGDMAMHYATPGYVGTNNFKSGLHGGIKANPDGLILPNMDLPFDNTGGEITQASCSATIPVVERLMGTPSSARLLTIHKSRGAGDTITNGSSTVYLDEMFIRPVDPWSPDYLEDKSFQACVPVADPYTEPPLHFYTSGNGASRYMSWCTLPYPTQNPYWTEVNKKRKLQTNSTLLATVANWDGAAHTAATKHFTSYDYSAGSVDTATLINNYNNLGGAGVGACLGNLEVCKNTLGTGHADYNACRIFLGENVARNSCDRTVRYDSSQDFRSFPLQASSNDIDSMLASDKTNGNQSFACTYSVSNNSANVGTKIPSSGCCGYYNGSKVLNSIMPANGAVTTGHLEPFVNSAFPTVRFCGSPVQ